MASDYIVDKEIAIIRERQAKGEPVHFYPLLLTPTPKAGLDKVKDKNLRPRDAKPLFRFFPARSRSAHDGCCGRDRGHWSKKQQTRKSVGATQHTRPAPAWLRAHHRPARDRLRASRRPRRRAEASRRGVGRCQDQHPLAHRRGRRGQVGAGQRMAQAAAGRQLSRRRGGAGLVVLQPGLEGARDLGGGIPQLGARQARHHARHHQRHRQGRGDRRGDGKAPRAARARRRRAAAARPRQAAGRAEGLRACAPCCGALRRCRRPRRAGWSCSPAGCRSRTSRAGRTARRRSSMSSELSEEAGAALLRDNGVWGTDRELAAAARDFGGHPLALGLLASFLTETQTGDVRRRDHVRAYLRRSRKPAPRPRPARDGILREGVAGRPAGGARDHAHGRPVRPAGERRLPRGVAPGAGDRRAHRRGRRSRRRRMAARGRAPARGAAAGAARPCGARRARCPSAGARVVRRAAEGRRTKRHGRPPMAGSTSTCATRPRKARRRRSKTSRRSTRPSPTAAAPAATRRRWTRFTQTASAGGSPTATSSSMPRKKLGALGSDLAAISWFFDEPYETPVATLTPADQVLGAQRSCLSLCARKGDSPRRCRPSARRCGWPRTRRTWDNAAIAASNLSEAELLVGEVAAAVATAERSVAHADRSGDEFQMMMQSHDLCRRAARRRPARGGRAGVRRRRAAAEGMAARISAALFPARLSVLRPAAGQGRLRSRARPGDRTINGIAGSQSLAARYRARRAHPRPRPSRTGARDRWRAATGSCRRARTRAPPAPASTRPSTAYAPPGNADDVPAAYSPAPPSAAASATGTAPRAISTRSRRSPSRGRCGSISATWRSNARGSRSRASRRSRRSMGSSTTARRSRSGRARRSASACTTKRQSSSPSRPTTSKTCGYHRRDEELAELQAVLRGERTFADLPPRV